MPRSAMLMWTAFALGTAAMSARGPAPVSSFGNPARAIAVVDTARSDTTASHPPPPSPRRPRHPAPPPQRGLPDGLDSSSWAWGGEASVPGPQVAITSRRPAYS